MGGGEPRKKKRLKKEASVFERRRRSTPNGNEKGGKESPILRLKDRKAVLQADGKVFVTKVGASSP